MEAHEQRVVEEQKELDAKIDKLDAFTGTETFKNLEEADTMLLLRQMDTMRKYSDILTQRIARFS